MQTDQLIDLSAPAPVLFDTTAAQDRFAVDLNIENEASWSTDVSFSTEALGIELTSFSLDAFSFNNSGNIQGQNVVREVDITLIISEDGGAELFNEKANDVHLNPPGPDGGPFPVSFDTSLVSLAPNTAYTLTLIASSDTRVRGNNAAIDTLILSGTLTGVPLPAGFSLLLAGLAGFAALRRRA